MAQEAKWLHSDPSLSLGYVYKVFENSYLVVDSYDPLIRIHAKRATSCLIEPQKGDTVALMLAANNKAYILHILERENSEARLLLPAQTEICLQPICQKNIYLKSNSHKAKDFMNNAEMNTEALKSNAKNMTQSLKINADNITFNCEQKLSLVSSEMNTISNKLHLGADTLLITGQTLLTRFENIRTTCKHALEKIQYHIGSYTKKIDHAEDIIELQSKRTILKNSETLRIQNKNTRIHAEQSVDVDGESIRLG